MSPVGQRKLPDEQETSSSFLIVLVSELFKNVGGAMNLEAESPFITEAGSGYWLAHPGKSWSQLTFVSPTGFVTRVRLRNLPEASYLEYETHGYHSIAVDSITVTTHSLSVLAIEPAEGELFESKAEAIANAQAKLVELHQDDQAVRLDARLSTDGLSMILTRDGMEVTYTRPTESTLLQDWGIVTL